jgi:GntR family transcriptional repressor for pyruvate dehydrogenase complex
MAISNTELPEKARTSRSAEITAILRDEILSGQYRPGERLPSERDLSERFSSSRGAVREALKMLDQLGIATIQPGGARVVAVEACTLDVLGPLLDLHEIPEPKLVDEVLHVVGILMDAAAQAAIEKASEEQLEQALSIIDEILGLDSGDVRQHEALRRLWEFYIDVADHLVLRLMINGLRTSFLGRVQKLGIRPRLNSEYHREQVNRLRDAVVKRNPAKVGAAMKGLNRLFRDAAREALSQAEIARTRKFQ